MKNKPKVRKVGVSKKVIELPEELTGKQLKSWVRRRHIPLLRRKMRRIRDHKGERIKAQITDQNRNLKLVRCYPKDHPPMRRIRRPKKVVFTRVRTKK